MLQRIAAGTGPLRRSVACDRPGFATQLVCGDRRVIMRRDDTHACARRMESVQGAEAFVSVQLRDYAWWKVRAVQIMEYGVPGLATIRDNLVNTGECRFRARCYTG